MYRSGKIIILPKPVGKQNKTKKKEEKQKTKNNKKKLSVEKL